MSHGRKNQPVPAADGPHLNDAAEDAAVFDAVAAAAPEMDLELESTSRLDQRMVGVFAAPSAHSSSPQSDDDGSSLSADATDDDDIKEALTGWAETHPADVVERHGDFTADPYAAVMPGGVQLVDTEFLENWVGSDEYNEILGRWSPKKEREANLHNIQVIHLSDSVASATFQGRELGEGDVPVVCNVAAILIKAPNGRGTTWKIASVSKFGDFE
ncbi:MAG: hypothetical protein AAGF23_02715 [Acidobacteriota bacterium]